MSLTYISTLQEKMSISDILFSDTHIENVTIKCFSGVRSKVSLVYAIINIF